jgi:hypothetical protein
VLAVGGFEIRVTPDVDETAFGIKDPVRGANVSGKKTTQRSGVGALRRRMLHVPLIQRVVQCMNGYWMFQCSTPLYEAAHWRACFTAHCPISKRK